MTLAGGQPAPAPVPRGKKGKIKKMKEKYADQDEEERQLRMEILKVHASRDLGRVFSTTVQFPWYALLAMSYSNA